MYDILTAGLRLQEARAAAGLSQADVAERCGTSQSAIARLEGGSANATVATLVRTAAAAGYAIHIDLVPLPAADPVIERYKADVDRASLRENRRRSVAERLQSLGEWQVSLATLAGATQRQRRRR
ncbi:MAG: helix-turn-helix transcriptional regulator [Gemmatimonadaceae bacterium]|nr:helix-turn-helix transcriptional regulator [Gemmatimonadaceae bacterium]